MKKRLLSLAAAAVVTASVFAGGCFVTSGADGVDGKDGQNASAYQYYELALEQGLVSSLDEFLTKYLNYTPDELDKAFSLQRNMNKSMLSGVTIVSRFSASKTSYGSGVVVDYNEETGDAYIVTNCHVVYNDTTSRLYAPDIYCYLYGQDADYNAVENRFKASVVAGSITYDIALLKVEGGKTYKYETGNDEATFLLKNSNVLAAEFVTEDDVYVGEEVYAVGNSEAQSMSVTVGHITKERETISLNLSNRHENDRAYYKDYRVIRTDAAINEGNSGGALFNKEGKLIAIVNAKVSSVGVENMGYALPASNVRRLIKLMRSLYETSNKMVTDSTLVRAYLSAEIEATALPSWFNEEAGRTEVREQVTVTEANGELQIGDTIQHIKITDARGNVVEDRPVTRLYHIDDTLLSAREGYMVTLTVKRGGEQIQVPANLTFKAVD